MTYLELEDLPPSEVERALEQPVHLRGFFTDEEVTQRLGFESATLKQLHSIRFVKPMRLKRPGRGWLRAWSYPDLLKLSTLAALTNYGHLSTTGAAALLGPVSDEDWTKIHSNVFEAPSMEMIRSSSPKFALWPDSAAERAMDRGHVKSLPGDCTLRLLNGSVLRLTIPGKPIPGKNPRFDPALNRKVARKFLGFIDFVKGREVPGPRTASSEEEMKYEKRRGTNPRDEITSQSINLSLALRDFLADWTKTDEELMAIASFLSIKTEM